MSQSIYKLLADHKLFNKSVKFGLTRIKLALKLLDHPERKLKNVINVVGESGKFTTLYSLKSFIEANNQTVSTHISPSLKSIRERFYMGKRYLSYNEIRNTIEQIENLSIPLTVFECMTLIYILNASKFNNDYNILETGCFVRHDANSVHDFPLIQICTNINKQHLNFLRKNKRTLNEVIKEDTAYLSNFSCIYISKQTPKVLRKVKSHLKKNKSKIVYPNSWKLIKIGNSFFFKDKNTRIKLNTKHVHSKGMRENVCLAIKVALDLKIDKKIIQKTLPKLFFEGRFQYLKKGKIKRKLHKNESIVIDGAHSPWDAKNMSNYLKSIKKPKYAILAMMKNKQPDLFIKNLKGVFKKIYTVPIDNEKGSLKAKELYKIVSKNKIKSEYCKNFNEALKKITSKETKLVVVLGSLYQIGNILNRN